MSDWGRIAWVAGTISLISFIGLSSQYYVVIPSHSRGLVDDDTALRNLLLPFNILLASVYVNYILCAVTGPGHPPKGYAPQKYLSSTEGLTLRYCKKCDAYKPPRAHHCKVCGRCVLKMDHHCPWVGCCVGYSNYGHFLRFLCSVNLACSFHLFMITRSSLRLSTRMLEPSVGYLLYLIFNYIACVPVLIGVGTFTLFHLYSVAQNTTTIEGWEKDKAESIARRGKGEACMFPFDVGLVRNFQAVLGWNVLLWCVPQRMAGDGLLFPTPAGVTVAEQFKWPPRDEEAEREREATREYNRKRALAAAGSEGFTYGAALNPNLKPTRSKVRGQDLSSASLREQESSIPASTYDEQEQRLFSSAVHVRRGSEGFEVRPARFSASLFPDPVFEDDDIPLGNDRYRYYESRPLESDSENDP